MNYLRIKKNADFQKVFKRGKRVFSPNLSLICYPSEKMRMGIAVSKKHGKAVRRNRIKRLLREAFRLTCSELERNYCIIVLPKMQSEYTFRDFKTSFSSCFKKMNKCANP